MPAARIVSVQVGLPRQFAAAPAAEPPELTWTSAIVKEPIVGPAMVGLLNIAGDGQADLVHHGGPDKAVLAYSADHYDVWRAELDLDELPHGAFGENLTIRGLTEREVCIGDVWRVNDVVFQVSQPRQPCWKLGRRWQRMDLPKRVVQSGRSGWYLRVLQEGVLQSGLEMILEQRLHPQWTVARVANVRYDKRADGRAVEALANLESLAHDWRDDFARRSD